MRRGARGTFPVAGDGGFAGRPRMSSLYLREAQVVELFSLGLTSKEISAALRISIHSVNWHRRQALARQRAAMTPKRAPISRTTSTMSSTSDSVVRQFTIAGRKATTPQ